MKLASLKWQLSCSNDLVELVGGHFTKRIVYDQHRNWKRATGPCKRSSQNTKAIQVVASYDTAEVHEFSYPCVAMAWAVSRRVLTCSFMASNQIHPVRNMHHSGYWLPKVHM
jgi:hypothetical protein